jgi:predicted metal-dependent hydrolase
LVVCHELTHFWHHDHSAAFYRQLGAVLPQHKALRAQLKNEKIPRFAWEERKA